MEIKLYKVKKEYVEFLRNHPKYGEPTLYEGSKENRPYFGPISIDNHNYFVPLTLGENENGDIKKRLGKLPEMDDYLPIKKYGKLLAGIEFNKMIPVPESQLRSFQMYISEHDKCDARSKKSKINLFFENQWCTEHCEKLITKANDLFVSYNANTLENNIKKRCVNFKNLEKACNEYTRGHRIAHKISKNGPSNNNSNRQLKHDKRKLKHDNNRRRNKKNYRKTFSKISNAVIKQVSFVLNEFQKSLIDIPRQLSEAHECCIATHQQVLSANEKAQSINQNIR